jgi:short-subunit dehydrogenase
MKLALPRMQRRGSGHLVNIASQAGKAGFPGGATYCGTKHFVVGVSEAVRAELRDSGIEISVVMPAVVNTELGSGLPETRAIKKLEPEDVADAIVDALERPKFDVWVPRESVGIYKFMTLLPRGPRERISRMLKADKVLADADQGARAAYEERAAHSEPGLDEDAAGEPAKTASQ